MSKKTVIIGASVNPSRYAYLATEMLTEYGHQVVPIGLRKGELFGKLILPLAEQPAVDNVDTVTLYMNPVNQKPWVDYILSLKPRRIIFNPGTENPELEAKAKKAGIETVHGCTLVMLRTGQY